MVKFLIICLILMVGNGTIEAAQQVVENIPLYNHGMLFEQLGNVKLQFGEWVFESTLNLNSLRKEIHAVGLLSQFINTTCSKIDPDFGVDCTQIIEEIQNDINEFNSVSDIIKTQCGTGELVSRAKRQIDFLGHIIKEITGVMDHDDSRRVDKDLEKLKNNEQQLSLQLQKQNIAIDSIFDITNRTIFSVQNKLANFSIAIDIYNKQKSAQNTKNMVRNHLTDLIEEINLILIHVTKRKDLYLTLLETGEQDLTPIILDPSNFLTELQKADLLLGNGFKFPTALNHENIMKYYRFSKVFTEVYGCDIKTRIVVPTVSNIIFTAFKSTSVPMLKDNKLFIVPIENDVILKSNNHNNTMGSSMKFSDYKTCISLQDFNLCPSTNTFGSLLDSDSCNIQMFVNSSTNTCIFQPPNLKHQLWIQMADKNSWIYAIPNSTKIGILSKKEMTYMELSGVGKLKLLKSCLVKSGNIFLHYFSSGVSNVEIEHIKIDFPQAPKIKYLDEKVPDTIQHSVISNYNDKELFNEIINLKNMNAGKVQLMDIELEKHSISIWTAIFIVLMVIILSWSSFKLYTYLKLKFGGRRRSAAPRRPTAPPRVMEPLQVVFTTNERNGFSDNSEILVNSSKNNARSTRQMLGQISF